MSTYRFECWLDWSADWIGLPTIGLEPQTGLECSVQCQSSTEKVFFVLRERFAPPRSRTGASSDESGKESPAPSETPMERLSPAGAAMDGQKLPSESTVAVVESLEAAFCHQKRPAKTENALFSSIISHHLKVVARPDPDCGPRLPSVARLRLGGSTPVGRFYAGPTPVDVAGAGKRKSAEAARVTGMSGRFRASREFFLPLRCCGERCPQDRRSVQGRSVQGALPCRWLLACAPDGAQAGRCACRPRDFGIRSSR